MGRTEPLVGILADAVKGIVEWLPVSSQGNLALFLTAAGTDHDVALQLALFLQLGTTLSAAGGVQIRMNSEAVRFLSVHARKRPPRRLFGRDRLRVC